MSIILMKRYCFKTLVVLILLAGCSFGEGLHSEKIIVGAVQQEGAAYTKTNSYQALALAIKYLNTYFQARGIDLRLYPRPQMGTYFETLDRLRKRKLDLAVLPSFIYLAAGEDADFKLVGILDYPRSWRSLIVVPKESAIGNLRDLAKVAGKLKIVYVNELSASGYVIPKIYFSDMKINFQEEIFSEGHLTSLEKMRAGEYGKEAVLAVDEVEFDRFRRTNPEKAAWFKEIYAIENPMILKDCVFVSANASAEDLRQLKEAFDPRSMAKVKDPRARGELERLYREISGAMGFKTIVTDVDERVFDYNNKYLARYNFNFTEHFSVGRVLEKIADDIDNRRRADPGYRPKVAVVLSGGGASGSYQAGVLKALQEKLDEFNQQQRRGKPPLTIDLVAGTSIGAFNGIFYSLGRLDILSEFYSTVKADNIFEPYWRFKVYKLLTDSPFMLILGLILGAYVYGVLLRRTAEYDFSKIKDRNYVFPILIWATLILIYSLAVPTFVPMLAFIFIFAEAGYFLVTWFYQWEKYVYFRLEKYLKEGRWIRNIIKGIVLLLFALTPGVFSWYFIAAGERRLSLQLFSYLLAFYLAIKYLGLRGQPAFVAGLLRKKIFVGFDRFTQIGFVVFGFVGLFIISQFLSTGQSFCNHSGIEASYIKTMAKAVGVSPELGKAAISEKVLQGITRNELMFTAADIIRGKEVYLYYQPLTAESQYLPADVIWISLRDYSSKLIDALIGSASAMVVFPMRKMMIANKIFELNDGSFFHHIPVDAANTLGATHLIIISATEDVRRTLTDPEKWSLGDYIGNLDDILLFGTQTVDYLGRGKRMSFIILPLVRVIGNQHFNGVRVRGKIYSLKDFMNQGYKEAMGKENGFRMLSAGEFILK